MELLLPGSYIFIYTILVFLGIFLVPYVFFIYAQYSTLNAIDPANRKMNPFEVWFQLIPLFGLIWQFVVVGRIADSIREEYQSQKDISFLGIGDGDLQENINERVTYTTGYWYCVMLCCSFIPILGFFIGLGMLALLITYWRQLIRHRDNIRRNRSD